MAPLRAPCSRSTTYIVDRPTAHDMSCRRKIPHKNKLISSKKNHRNVYFLVQTPPPPCPTFLESAFIYSTPVTHHPQAPNVKCWQRVQNVKHGRVKTRAVTASAVHVSYQPVGAHKDPLSLGRKGTVSMTHNGMTHKGLDENTAPPPLAPFPITNYSTPPLPVLPPVLEVKCSTKNVAGILTLAATPAPPDTEIITHDQIS